MAIAPAIIRVFTRPMSWSDPPSDDIYRGRIEYGQGWFVKPNALPKAGSILATLFPSAVAKGAVS
jgi:hypothetical protein